jgi:tetratricopeptide (TPR) repeat protein
MAERVEELYDAGYARLKAGDHAAAIQLIDTAIAADPGDQLGLLAELWDYKGRSLAALGRGAEAVAAFERAVGLAPRVPEFAVGLADALRAAGDLARARSLYERALNQMLPGEELAERIERGLDALGP